MTDEQQNLTVAPRPASRGIGHALCVLLLLLFAFAIYRLSLRLAGQSHYFKAKGLLKDGYVGLALVQLEKAVQDQHGDDEVYKALGQVYFKLGVLALKRNARRDAFDFVRKSRASYLTAKARNPIDAYSAYGIARAEARLIELYRSLHPGSKDLPYNPEFYLKEALRLRPNRILYRYAYARYLYDRGRDKALTSAIRELVRIYPPVYDDLRHEAFWSPQGKEACKEGLELAVKENILPRVAQMALSSMMAREQQWPAAISRYKKALSYKAVDNKVGDYVHLGALYLKNGQFKEARACFFRALGMSRSRGKVVKQLYYLYRDQELSEKFERFYRDADHTLILPFRAEIFLARTLMDLKQYSQAQRILRELVQKKSDAEAYSWLARIAQAENDWDSMELTIQKATVLEPGNSTYHLLFSQALARKKKLERAEKEADLVLKYQKKPSPWSFNNRAWIRWARKDYQGALQDWLRAIGLKRDRAGFYAHAGDAEVMLGHGSAAVEYYEKALKLDPENERYQRRYQKIKKNEQKTPNIQTQ